MGLSGVDWVHLKRGGAAPTTLGGKALTKRHLGEALKVKIVPKVQGEGAGIAHHLPEGVALMAGPGTYEVELAQQNLKEKKNFAQRVPEVTKATRNTDGAFVNSAEPVFLHMKSNQTLPPPQGVALGETPTRLK